MTPMEMVREFHQAFGVPVASVPSFPSRERQKLRHELIDEERWELFQAMLSRDISGIADALADLTYVVYGTALEYGIDLDAVLAEVHRSNMSKLGANGKPILREDGKVLKGPAYSRPDIESVLERQVSA